MMYFEKRPWGSFEILAEGKTYKIKKIIVNPGMQLSLQSHSDRNESWEILSGEGLLTLDGYQIDMKKDDSIKIYAEQKHRIKNISAEHDLIFIEVQTGDCDELDIKRYDDDWNRHLT